MQSRGVAGIVAWLGRAIRRGSFRRDRRQDGRRVLPEEVHNLFDEELNAHSASLDRMLKDRKSASKP